jgi:hypothetical protein
MMNCPGNFLDFRLHLTFLEGVRFSLQNTIEEIKQKQSKFDTSRMEQAVTEVAQAEIYFRNLWEQASIESKRNTDLTLANLKLIAELNELKKQLENHLQASNYVDKP